MSTVARGLALTVVALVTLVPIQATSAGAFVGELDVEPETVDRITGSIQRYTASVTPAEEDLQISYVMGSPSSTSMNACMTDADGTCEFTITRAIQGEVDLLVYVEDGGMVLPCTRPSFPSGHDCDGNEAQEDVDDDDTDVVLANFLDGVLDIEPEEEAFAPSSDVTFEATVVEKDVAEGEEPTPLLANVDAEIEAGPNQNNKPATVDMECDTDATTGMCDLTYTAASDAGIDEIRGWVDLNDDPDADPETGDETSDEDFEADEDEGRDEEAEAGAVEEGDITDVVQADISGGEVLVLSPQTATRTIGSQSALTATFTSAGTPTSGTSIAAEVLTGGANAGQTATCQTAANGQCTLNYTGANAGTDKVRATVDVDGDGLPNEADATEDVDTDGGTPEPDTTDVSQITWALPAPPPGPVGQQNQCDKNRPTAQDDEILIGTNGADQICGFGGNDTLRGRNGGDTLRGGPGADVHAGGRGKDALRGGKGKDTLRGGKGNDNLRGGKGKDTMRGGKGKDDLRGGKGKDTMRGGKGKDTLRGGKGRDAMRGGKGKDTLRGGKGRDTAQGGKGRDLCRAEIERGCEG